MENVTLSQSTFWDGMIQRLLLRGRGRSVVLFLFLCIHTKVTINQIVLILYAMQLLKRALKTLLVCLGQWAVLGRSQHCADHAWTEFVMPRVWCFMN